MTISPPARLRRHGFDEKVLARMTELIPNMLITELTRAGVDINDAWKLVNCPRPPGAVKRP
jgi:hypothetical protein